MGQARVAECLFTLSYVADRGSEAIFLERSQVNLFWQIVSPDVV